MVNPHPPLAMFPPVLGLTIFALECAEFKFPGILKQELRGALVIIFSVMTIATYYSGFWGVEFAERIPAEIIKNHQGFARFSALLTLPICLLGLLYDRTKRWISYSYLCLLGVMAALLLYTAHLGGEVVFIHGGGVAGVGYK